MHMVFIQTGENIYEATTKRKTIIPVHIKTEFISLLPYLSDICCTKVTRRYRKMAEANLIWQMDKKLSAYVLWSNGLTHRPSL